MNRRWLMLGAAAAGTFTVLYMLTPKSAIAKRAGRRELERMAKRVDKYIPGFSTFAVAAAYHESRWSNRARNTSKSEVKASCNGWERLRDTTFADNPYGERHWCIGSGGFFGFIPSTALYAQGFHNKNPNLIFDPAASVAMFASFVARVTRHWPKLPPNERNWLTLRRFMAGNTVGFDWREQKVLRSDKDGVPRSVKIRLNFPEALTKAGAPDDFMYETVTVQHLPSPTALWRELR